MAVWSVLAPFPSKFDRPVNVVLNRTVVDSDRRFDNLCGSNLQSQGYVVLVTSVDGIRLWLLTCLVNYVPMLLVVCQVSNDVIGYEYIL